MLTFWWSGLRVLCYFALQSSVLLLAEYNLIFIPTDDTSSLYDGKRGLLKIPQILMNMD